MHQLPEIVATRRRPGTTTTSPTGSWWWGFPRRSSPSSTSYPTWPRPRRSSVSTTRLRSTTTTRTWNAYNNQYWPAEYLIDQQGVIRHEEFGEGDYSGTETAIRALLEAGGATNLPPPTDVPNRTPTGNLSPETYVGYTNLQAYGESFIADPCADDQRGHRTTRCRRRFLSGRSRSVGRGRSTPKRRPRERGAQLELGFLASDVYLVLGGTGTVQVSVDGRHLSTVDVSGVPGLYTMVGNANEQTGTLELSFSPGVEAYDFTFG